MKLLIKNMYNTENREFLLTVLNDLGIMHEKELRLGELTLHMAIPQEKFQVLKSKLEDKGMSIIYDRKQILAEQVKHVVLEMLEKNQLPEENYSQFISKRLFLNYTYLANIFSETQGITIEHYIINQKIEKVKEYLLCSDYSISNIADLLGYSSIGHLSNQFKKVTGVNPTEFKRDQHNKKDL